MRKLIDGRVIPELDKAMDLTIHTKCPEKWILIDTETGQKYTGTSEPHLYGKWKRLEDYWTGQ